jgi:hypothetical protein
MSNQVYKNGTVRYDNANTESLFLKLLANESVPNDADTKVSTFSVAIDEGMGANLSLVGGDLTVKKAGLYSVSFTAIFDGNITGTRQVFFYRNHPTRGQELFGKSAAPAPQNAAVQAAGNVGATLLLGVDDVLQFYVKQDSGGALDLIGAPVVTLATKVVVSRIG